MEEAVLFFRYAVGKNIELHDLAKEGLCRNNLANTLIKLERFDEARQEILRAIECSRPFGLVSQPWSVYHNLFKLEKTVGNKESAFQAWKKAFQLFMEFRRTGGENHDGGGDLCTRIIHLLESIRPEEVGNMYREQITNFTGPESGKLFLSKLLLVLAGSRDRALVEDMNLDYDDAVELALLLEKLEGK